MIGYVSPIKVQKQLVHSQTISKLISDYKDLYYHNKNVQA